MSLPKSLRRPLIALGLLLMLASSSVVAAPSDRTHMSAEMRNEVQCFLALLERVHYNRNAVQQSDYIQVIPDFMSELDGQKLFFLGSDRDEFVKRNSATLYYNLHALGSIDPAYEIYDRYQERMRKRIEWVFKELDKDIDLNTHEFYRIDRSKSDWPENMAAADDVWRKLLKYEVIAEMLGKKTLPEAKQAVRKRYERMLKNVSEIDDTDVAEIFLTCFAKLYDPHSSYFSAESFEDFDITMKLQLIGIGAVLSVEEDNCVVKEIVPGGPADLDNRLKPNDKILAVAQGDGESVDIIGMKLRKIVQLIRGAKGTKVRLTVQPAGATDSSARREIVLTRDTVKLNSARAFGGVFKVPSSDGKSFSSIGVITLPSFYGGEGDPGSDQTISASKDVAQLLQRMKDQHVQGIVLDLRRNGGGLLSEAIDLTGLFIGRGPVVQVRNYNGGIDVDSDDDPGIAYSGPLAVLVDRFSASASEIVTGALQNYGRAIVIGDSSTHGKGTVQNIIDLKRFLPPSPDSAKAGAVKLTIQKFYLPSGASTQLKGVVPDIVLDSYEDYLPVGEKDLPHALVWDEIPSSFFDGAPIPPSVDGPLKEASLERQRTLPEFDFLRRNIAWFKAKQEQKLVSLNLVDRQKQKADDEAFRKGSKAEEHILDKDAYAFTEIRLAPKPPKPKVAPKSPGDDSQDSPLDEPDDDESYGKMDIHLREALRVVRDALDMAHDPKHWNHRYEPLTAEAVEMRYGS